MTRICCASDEGLTEASDCFLSGTPVPPAAVCPTRSSDDARPSILPISPGDEPGVVNHWSPNGAEVISGNSLHSAMMATTHALAGLLLAIPVAVIAPDLALPAAIGAIAGGVFPDVDMPGEHRRTLHYPVYYSLAAALVVVVAVLFPGPVTVLAAVFLASAALHSLSDGFGGGLELRPWEATSERAVYSHYHRRWWRPRRWVRYDGAPEDAALGLLLAVPSVLFYEGYIELFVLGAVALGVVYAAIRRPMVEWTQRLVDRLPPELLDRLPDRLVEDFR